MRHTIVFAVCTLICAAACQPVEMPVTEAGVGSLVISVKSGDVAATKSNTDPAGLDASIHDIQVFLFTQDGRLYMRDTLDMRSSRSFDGVKAGYYTIAALANAPALTSIQTQQELEQAQIALSDNQPDKGFLMYGVCQQPVIVVSGATAPAIAEIRVERHVGRVRLTTVKNKLPADLGTLTVKGVFLENALGSWAVGGAGQASAYLNYAGRKSGRNQSTEEADLIKSSAAADCAALTWKDVNSPVARGDEGESFGLPLYTFPNSCVETEDHFAGPTADKAAVRLVLLVSYGSTNEEWYYPVTIYNLLRNKSYDVSFTISGPGTKDPNRPITNGNLAVQITVDPWGEGGTISGDF